MELKLTKQITSTEEVTVNLPIYFKANTHAFGDENYCHLTGYGYELEVVNPSSQKINVYQSETMLDHYISGTIRECTAEEFREALTATITNRWRIKL